MTGFKLAAVISAVATLSACGGGGHSSAWKLGYSYGSGTPLNGCNQQAQNYVTMNVIGYDDWNDFVAGCNAGKRSAK
jgi:hypothetical protein